MWVHIPISSIGLVSVLLDCTTAQRAAPHDTPQSELSVLREKLQSIMADIRSKRSSLTVQELRRLLYRCAAVLVSMDQASV
jgi:phosphatidylinositol 4-kinase